MTRKGRLPAVVFACALLVAVVVRLMFPFDGLYGQDAYSYFDYARAFWPHLRHGTALPALFWPVGYPVTVALVLPLFGGSPIAGQMVNTLACAWAGVATFLMVEGLGRSRRPRGSDSLPGFVAGLAVALSGGVLRSSQVVMADGLGLGAAATALWCAVRFGRSRVGPWLAACSLALAWGTITRWMVGLLALPIGAYLLIDWRSDVTDADRGPATARPLWPWAVTAALLALAVLTPQMMLARSEPFVFSKHEWLVKWNLANAIGRAFYTRDGHALYKLPVAVFYLARLGWPDYFFSVLALFAAAGAWIVLRERRWAAAVLFIGWPFVAWVFLSGIPYENPRFLLPTLPAVAALSGVGFSWLWDSLPPRRRWIPALVLAGSFGVGLVLATREHARLVAHKNADQDLVVWVAAQVPLRATVLMAGPTLAFQFFGFTAVQGLFDLSASQLDAVVAGQSPVFVVADVGNLEGQWAGLGPELHLRNLRRHPGLTLLAEHPPYSLFRVGP